MISERETPPQALGAPGRSRSIAHEGLFSSDSPSEFEATLGASSGWLEDLASIEQIVRIERGFDATHERKLLCAP